MVIVYQADKFLEQWISYIDIWILSYRLTVLCNHATSHCMVLQLIFNSILF